MKTERVAVIGAGGWGTTLSIILADNGCTVTMWTVEESVKHDIESKQENTVYLPDVAMPKSIRITTDLQTALHNASLVIIAVPSKYVENVLEDMSGIIPGQACFVSVVKGLRSETFETMSEVIARKLSLGPSQPLAVLSGPNLAFEVSRKIPSTTVVAARQLDVAQRVLQAFMAPYFRVYVTEDVKGVELGGALKNVMAIGAGMSDGLGYGVNAKAALISRGLVEMIRLGNFLGARTQTFFGLSGLGDMVATCFSPHSRNRALGERLAQGEQLDEILATTKTVAEGVGTTRSVRSLSLLEELEMPITEAVFRLLFEGMSFKDGVRDLMQRDPKEEWAG